MTVKYIHIAEVRGSGAFPLDMLRYDACWPTHQEDVLNIGTTLGRNAKERTVSVSTITTHRITKDAIPFTEGRWRSFGWTLTYKRAIRVD